MGVTASLEGRSLYLCTPDRPDLESFVSACMDGGVDIVQLREKTLDDRTLVARAKVLARLCAARGVPFIVNDRPELALQAGADGVHVGQDDASPVSARRILGPDALVGLSTHAPAELRASRSEPVDYVSAGPVSPTPTKPGRPGTGLEYVRFASANASRPVFVTGGVTPLSIPSLAAAGATRFVVVRYLTESHDPRGAAAELRRTITAVTDARHATGTGPGGTAGPGAPPARPAPGARPAAGARPTLPVGPDRGPAEP